jgi:alkylation response protein AidB-like acyl-CoA dehydrogenase
VNLALSPEQGELRSSVRTFLEQKSPETAVRRLIASDEGFDRDVWRQMGAQLGLMALAIPEEYGGAGFSFAETAIVLEEMGRRLLCAPFFASAVVSAATLLATDDENAKNSYLPGIASGDTIATLALVESSGRWDEAGIADVTASQAGGGWTLSGTKWFVLDGQVADLFLVAARADRAVSLFAVEAQAAGVRRTALSTLDLTRRLSRLHLDGVPATLVGAVGDGWQALERVLDIAAVALAAEQVGGAEFVLDMAVEYAKNRVQFGRPIGSFQAVKHACADMLLAVESAKSAAYYAARCVASGDPELPVVAAVAKSFCSEAYFKVASDNIQVHGGIGFTWEHPAHLYFRRAKSSELMLGDPAYWRELLARRIKLDGS